METIGSATYFQLCKKCGAHGCFVLATGEETKPRATKKGALQLIRELQKESKVTEFEVPHLEWQIENSDLDYEDEEEESALRNFLLSLPEGVTDLHVGFSMLFRQNEDLGMEKEEERPDHRNLH